MLIFLHNKPCSGFIINTSETAGETAEVPMDQFKYLTVFRASSGLAWTSFVDTQTRAEEFAATVIASALSDLGTVRAEIYEYNSGTSRYVYKKVIT